MSTLPAIITGTIQIFCGILSIILGSIAITFKCAFSDIAWPVWGGAGIYLLTGLFGVLAQVDGDNTCGVLTYLVMSVMAICISVGQCILLSIATSVEWSWEHCPDCLNDITRRETVDAMAAGVGFVELLAALVAVIFCWWEICGREMRTREMLVDYPQPNRSGHLTVVTAGGYISGDNHSKGGGQKYAVQQPTAYPSHHGASTSHSTPYRNTSRF